MPRNNQLTLITVLTPRSEKQISVKVFMKGISPYLYKHFKNGLTSELHVISVNIFERHQHLITVKEFSITPPINRKKTCLTVTVFLKTLRVFHECKKRERSTPGVYYKNT